MYAFGCNPSCINLPGDINWLFIACPSIWCGAWGCCYLAFHRLSQSPNLMWNFSGMSSASQNGKSIINSLCEMKTANFPQCQLEHQQVMEAICKKQMKFAHRQQIYWIFMGQCFLCHWIKMSIDIWSALHSLYVFSWKYETAYNDSLWSVS